MFSSKKTNEEIVPMRGGDGVDSGERTTERREESSWLLSLPNEGSKHNFNNEEGNDTDDLLVSPMVLEVQRPVDDDDDDGHEDNEIDENEECSIEACPGPLIDIVNSKIDDYNGNEYNEKCDFFLSRENENDGGEGEDDATEVRVRSPIIATNYDDNSDNNDEDEDNVNDEDDNTNNGGIVKNLIHAFERQASPVPEVVVSHRNNKKKKWVYDSGGGVAKEDTNICVKKTGWKKNLPSSSRDHRGCRLRLENLHTVCITDSNSGKNTNTNVKDGDLNGGKRIGIDSNGKLDKFSGRKNECRSAQGGEDIFSPPLKRNRDLPLSTISSLRPPMNSQSVVKSDTVVRRRVTKSVTTITDAQSFRLSVFLRVRPTAVVTTRNIVGIKGNDCRNIKMNNITSDNTVELVMPTKKRYGNLERSDSIDRNFNSSNQGREKSVLIQMSLPHVTMIRTYPPPNSNFAKLLRPRKRSRVKGGGEMTSSLHTGVKEYSFHRVLGPSFSQADVYDSVAVPLVNGLFSSETNNDNSEEKEKDSIGGNRFKHNNGGVSLGQSALIFSYGVTNSGKTYTIIGNESLSSDSDDKGKNSCGDEFTNEQTYIKDGYGVIPRALHHIFQNIKKMENSLNNNKRREYKDKSGSATIATDQGDTGYQLWMSYFEIYNEKIFDLLPKEDMVVVAGSTKIAMTKTGSDRAFVVGGRPKRYFGGIKDNTRRLPLTIGESRGGKTFVRGLRKHLVRDVLHGLELVKVARETCHVSSNNINKESSRSHCICQLELIAHTSNNDTSKTEDRQQLKPATTTTATVGANLCGYGTDMDNDSTKKSRRSVTIWIVDLAGIERSKRTGIVMKSTRQKESTLINSSLMNLMRCLQSLQRDDNQRSSTYSSFRESKLTHLFMNHLSSMPASRTCMIVNINPSSSDFDETQHVLSYAAIARSINISENDFNRKKVAIQRGKKQEKEKRDYDKRSESTCNTSNNRGKENERIGNIPSVIKKKLERVQSPPRKIARVVNTLSSEALLTRQKTEKLEKKKKMKVKLKLCKKKQSCKCKMEETIDTNVDKCDRSHINISNTSSKERESTANSVEFEVESLHAELITAKMRVSELQSSNVKLQKKLNSCESNIRLELAGETGVQMKRIRQEHNSIIERICKQYFLSAPTPSQSAKKAKIDKVEKLIDELMDKLDECEEEMHRIQKSHRADITRLTNIHDDQMRSKNQEISSFRPFHEVTNTNLKETLDTRRKDAQILRLEENVKKSTFEGRSKISKNIGGYVGRRVLSRKERKQGQHLTPSSASTLRKLPRRKISEVACAKFSPLTMSSCSSSERFT